MNNRRPIRSQSGYDITQKVLESTMEMIGINDRSIAQMGEMEKRLLIILTLQYQMARSSAMGDFARTIENPANQLRVFQQQLSEVGRWISAVFYGTIAQVLPYINGFVMAIKELIKTFALFLGYELPDSSGDTGTILDQMGDSMGDFGAGIDNANSGLDETKKKAKEVAKAVGNLPFDELHTISKPSNPDSGSDSGSGGAGGAMVDPRILDALNKWDYMFGNIRMKAMDIRDTILEWADKIGKVVDENIFQPIKNSWDKYGAGISANVKETFKNISHIVGGVFDVIGEKWKPFFQQASDLFFSLEETASEVLKGISRFFVYVWDNGGKTLFEGIADLATAFLKLATKINDKFVKPLIRWFNDNIVPVIGKAVGTILGLVGNLLKGLAGIIDWIADCTPLVIALASAFTGVFLAIKIAKFVELVNQMKDGHKITKALVDILYDHNGLFKKTVDLWINGTGIVDKLKGAYSHFNSVLANTGVWKTITGLVAKGATSMVIFGESMKASNSILGNLAGAIISKLGSALAWLCANPLVAVALAIAGVVAVLATMSQSQEDTTVDIEKCSEAVQEQAEKVDDLSESMKNANETYKDNLVDAEANALAVEKAVKDLKSMAGKTGFIDNDNLTEAKVLVDKVNSSLGTQIEITEAGELILNASNEELKDSITLMKEKAEQEAKYQLYVEYQKEYLQAQMLENENREKATELEKQKQSLIEKNKKLFEEMKNYQYGSAKYNELAEQTRENINQIGILNTDIAGYNKVADDASKTTEECTKKFESLEYSSDNTSGSITELTDEMAKLYAGFKLSDEKALQFENMASVIIKNSEKMKTASDEERKKLQANTDFALLEYAEKAQSFELTYKEMLELLQAKGIELTDSEKQWLSDSYNALNEGTNKLEVEFQFSKKRTLETLKQHNSNMTSEEESQYALMLDNLNKNGIEVSAIKYEQYQSMMKAMKDHNIEVNSEQATQYTNLLKQLSDYGIDMSNEQNLQHLARLVSSAEQGDEEGKKYLKMLQDGVASGNIDPQVWKILSDAGYIFDTNPQTVGVDVENPRNEAQTIFDNIKGIFSSPLKVMLGVGMDTSQLGAKMGNAIRDALNIPRMATGGFPDVGQLFIANEAGPELIGNLGGRTAVANRYQIEEGIAKAVARGSMGNNSSAPQTINIHTTLDVDGETLAEVVHKSDSKKGFDFTKGGGKL